MTHSDKTWNARLKHNAQHSRIQQRNKPIVMALTVLTGALAITGLIADLQLGSYALAGLCYVVATLSGITHLAFLFNKRLWVTRRRGSSMANL